MATLFDLINDAQPLAARKLRGPQAWLAVARRLLRRRLEAGHRESCPLCDQHCKYYRRRLNSIMAQGLISLVIQARSSPGDWVHVEAITLQGREVVVMGGSFALLAHWRLIEPMRNDDTDKRCSGWWRPTDRGIAFAERRSVEPASGLFYNNSVLEWSEDQIDIADALGSKFNYADLMQPATRESPP